MSMNDTNADRLRMRSIGVADRDSANSERGAIVAPAAQDPIETRIPRILIAATVRWPLAARLAISFHSLGCSVHAWCPVGHPLAKTRAVERVHRYGVLMPRRSLRAAIVASTPDFIIPCDDDAAVHLQQLHDSATTATRWRVRRVDQTFARYAVVVPARHGPRQADGSGTGRTNPHPGGRASFLCGRSRGLGRREWFSGRDQSGPFVGWARRNGRAQHRAGT